MSNLFLLKAFISQDLSDDPPGYVGLVKNDTTGLLYPSYIMGGDITSAAVFTFDQQHGVPHMLITQGSPLGWSYATHDGGFTLNTAVADVVDFNMQFYDLPGQSGSNAPFTISAYNQNSRQSRPVGWNTNLGFALGANFWDDPNITMMPLYFQMIYITDASPQQSCLLTCNLSNDGSYAASLVLAPDGRVLMQSGAKNTILYYDASNHTVALAQGSNIPPPYMPVWFGTLPADNSLASQNLQQAALPLYWTTIGVWYADVLGKGFGNSMMPIRLFDLKNLQVGTVGILAADNLQLFASWNLSQPPPSTYEGLKRILTEAPAAIQKTPSCQGQGGGTSQICFFNHSPDDPNTPTFPSISNRPNVLIGYNRQAIGAPPLSDSSFSTFSESSWFKNDGVGDPVVYLGRPNDALGLNNNIISKCRDADANCPGNSPNTCAKDPSSYCHCLTSTCLNDRTCTQNSDCPTGYLCATDAKKCCTTEEIVCGLSCAEGLTPMKNGTPKFHPDLNEYWQNWQCIPTLTIGQTNVDGTQNCITWNSPGKRPEGTLFASMKDCKENWQTCPDGYERPLNAPRPGCYRKGDYNKTNTYNPCGTSCRADDSHCGPGWGTTSEGHCFMATCHSYCMDNVHKVPPWGYFCRSNVKGQDDVEWVQCKSDTECTSPGWLPYDDGKMPDPPGTNQRAWHMIGPDNFTQYCVVGSTPYAP
jgi:hypothetical protein